MKSIVTNTPLSSIDANLSVFRQPDVQKFSNALLQSHIQLFLVEYADETEQILKGLDVKENAEKIYHESREFVDLHIGRRNAIRNHTPEQETIMEKVMYVTVRFKKALMKGWVHYKIVKHCDACGSYFLPIAGMDNQYCSPYCAKFYKEKILKTL